MRDLISPKETSIIYTNLYARPVRKTKDCEVAYNVDRRSLGVDFRQRNGIETCRNEFAWSVLVTKAAATVSCAMGATNSQRMNGRNETVKEDAKPVCLGVVASVVK